MRSLGNIESKWRYCLAIQEQKHRVVNNLILCGAIFDEKSTQQHNKSVVVGIDGAAKDYLVCGR